MSFLSEQIKCQCGGEIIKEIGLGECVTLVGYASEPGHDHDDNCRKRTYLCSNGCKFVLSKRNKCHCGWEGQEECFCHKGKKISEWPDVPFDDTELQEILGKRNENNN